ncbi:phage minor head protein [Roseinatronobacter alkalisoli]|uniref:Phage minor head protein n=1 Tax=Roseinatronobacter alkalisoli TaxID=3028235 RepID=A0ABT5TEA4_9RHOB|nr:phage minor head protein [Roseinatronobacter sp. HJB301]MDD7973440.1 phage minor head protein [Roseinatronobacter sp. HJB301]
MARLDRRTRELLRGLEASVSSAFVEAIRDIPGLSDLKVFREALEARDLERAMRIIGPTDANFQRLDDAIREAYTAGGEGAIRNLSGIRDPQTGAIVRPTFDRRTANAVRWVQREAGSAIQGLNASITQVVREVLSEGIAEGASARGMVTRLMGTYNRATKQREGGVLGLTREQFRASENMAAKLSAGDYRSYFDYKLRNRRFDDMVERAMLSGDPLSPVDIRNIQQGYEGNMLTARGNSVAREEASKAYNAGRHESFTQVRDGGLVSNDQFRRTWRSNDDDRSRATHADQDGVEVIGLDTPHTLSDGTQLMYPKDDSLGADAEHTMGCRCFEEITIVRS